MKSSFSRNTHAKEQTPVVMLKRDEPESFKDYIKRIKKPALVLHTLNHTASLTKLSSILDRGKSR